MQDFSCFGREACVIYFFAHTVRPDIAGWSSLVARRAHNPEVVGSNPAPATKNLQLGSRKAPELFAWVLVGYFLGTAGKEPVSGDASCKLVGHIAGSPLGGVRLTTELFTQLPGTPFCCLSCSIADDGFIHIFHLRQQVRHLLGFLRIGEAGGEKVAEEGGDFRAWRGSRF